MKKGGFHAFGRGNFVSSFKNAEYWCRIYNQDLILSLNGQLGILPETKFLIYSRFRNRQFYSTRCKKWNLTKGFVVLNKILPPSYWFPLHCFSGDSTSFSCFVNVSLVVANERPQDLWRDELQAKSERNIRYLQVGNVTWTWRIGTKPS